MDSQVFELAKDFYTLKAEYQMNMQQLQKTNQKQNGELSELRRSINELRDHIAEQEEKADS